MACFSASIPKIPLPPSIAALLPPVITIPIGDLTFCCKFWEPFALNIPIPLGLILGPLNLIIQSALILIQTSIELLNSYLDLLQFSFSCPLD